MPEWSRIRKLAKKLIASDREPVAIELLRPYLDQFPEDSYMWFLYGDALRTVGRLQDAERALLVSLSLTQPVHKDVIHVRLAMVYEKQGDRELAEKHFSVALDGRNVCEMRWAWMLRGANLAVIGDLERACDCYSVAVDDPELSNEAYISLGLAYRAMGAYDRARMCLSNVGRHGTCTSEKDAADAIARGLPAPGEVESEMSDSGQSHQVDLAPSSRDEWDMSASSDEAGPRDEK